VTGFEAFLEGFASDRPDAGLIMIDEIDKMECLSRKFSDGEEASGFRPHDHLHHRTARRRVDCGNQKERGCANLRLTPQNRDGMLKSSRRKSKTNSRNTQNPTPNANAPITNHLFKNPFEPPDGRLVGNPSRRATAGEKTLKLAVGAGAGVAPAGRRYPSVTASFLPSAARTGLRSQRLPT